VTPPASPSPSIDVLDRYHGRAVPQPVHQGGGSNKPAAAVGGIAGSWSSPSTTAPGLQGGGPPPGRAVALTPVGGPRPAELLQLPPCQWDVPQSQVRADTHGRRCSRPRGWSPHIAQLPRRSVPAASSHGDGVAATDAAIRARFPAGGAAPSERRRPAFRPFGALAPRKVAMSPLPLTPWHVGLISRHVTKRPGPAMRVPVIRHAMAGAAASFTPVPGAIHQGSGSDPMSPADHAHDVHRPPDRDQALASGYRRTDTSLGWSRSAGRLLRLVSDHVPRSETAFVAAFGPRNTVVDHAGSGCWRARQRCRCRRSRGRIEATPG